MLILLYNNCVVRLAIIIFIKLFTYFISEEGNCLSETPIIAEEAACCLF